MLDLPDILTRFDPVAGTIEGAARTVRHLSDLRGIFADTDAYSRMLAAGDPIVYTVDSIEPAPGEGDLFYGIGTIMPGRVGEEFFMTKGHFHSWRPAAEVYIGLSGEGMMLLQHEVSRQSRLLRLEANSIVYVPGYTAHRTINTGTTPMTYIGIYPARAGHDYGAIAQRNFDQLVVERGGEIVMLERRGSGIGGINK